MIKKILNPDLLVGTIIVLIFIGFSYSGLSIFDALERHIYEMEMRFIQSEKQGSNKIALIDIDDKSLAILGSWPWPRNLIAEMINLLKNNGIKLIGLNIPFFEKEKNQGLAEVKAFRERFKTDPSIKKDAGVTTWILDNLKKMEENLDNDQRMVESVKLSGNVILPVLGHFGSHQQRIKREKEPSLLHNLLTSTKISPSLQKKLSVNQLSLPYSELAQTASGMGHGNLFIEKGMAGISHPLFILYKGSPLPSFPLRLAISHLNQKPKQVFIKDDQIQLKGNAIPLTNGEMLIKYTKGEKAFPRFSFADLLNTKRMPPALKGKIIIIGFNHKDSRHVNTPISPNLSEGELIANILDNIISNSFIVRPSYISYIEMFTLLLFGVLALFLFPRLGQIGRLGSMVGLIALTLTGGIMLFTLMGIWFKTIYIGVCLLTIYLFIAGRQLITSGKSAQESIETNRLLGLSLQSQGLLDLAFDKFKKIPLNNETKDLLYNLGLEYEKKRLINKALSVYEYITEEGLFRDLGDRIPKLKTSDRSSTIGSHETAKEASILADSKPGARSKVGRYEITGELGKGAMGLVYKAVDPKINRTVAIKTIRFSDEFDDDVIHEIKERFFREAEIAGQLSHPYIVTIYDVGDDQDLTYMAMEFLEGTDLDKHIDKKNLLRLRKVLDMVGKIADALDFAHKKEVIHRDIKPANIMLLNNEQVKVTDFGIAKAISSSRTRTGVILGTPNYMSPEQIMGQKIDSRSDIFSLGVLFYQLITAELPFHGENLSSLLYQITQVKHPPARQHNPKIPKVCDQIIDKALAKSPKDRFKTAGEMAKIIKLVSSKMDELKRKRAHQ